jgi:acyl transferase domain-containing protein/NADPH:quinone reductase-like Zn-dependent oxidoreductase/short-subunit dehydrogenase
MSGNGIAIVGMAGRFPGAADLDALWRNLRGGVDAISDLSDAELEAAGVEAWLRRDPRYVRAAARLEGVELFDAGFFGFNPREAELLDPQHRLFLECAWHALESAGCDPASWPGSIGVYAGSSLSGYLLHHLVPRLDFSGSVGNLLALTGNDKDYLASHTAYKLNLRGPAVGVQTACSTSLVAVHLACQSLLDQECDLALAGGVSIQFPLGAGYLYEEGGLRAPDGRCRTFSAEARGTVFGSGAGVVALKRLDDAVAAGDRIFAVIRGSAINNDGSAKIGYTAPSVEGEARVVAEALAVAGLQPTDLDYVEAHGTGTPLGDPIEIEALREVFGPEAPRGVCAIGSIKTNLGHLEAAAGVAGLIKTVLALRHGELPPSLHFSRPNPEIDFAASPFRVNAELRPWPAGGRLRRAGVSSFGIGGTNAHVVLEEAPASPAEAPPAGLDRPLHLLTLSARDEAALDPLAAGYRDLLASGAAPLADVAFSANTGRARFGHRLAVVAGSAAEAARRLETGAPGVFRGVFDSERPPRVAFLFPGQGVAFGGLGRRLYRSHAGFRRVLDLCDAALRGRLPAGLSLSGLLFDERAEPSLLARTEWAQPALYALQCALVEVWRGWGVRPAGLLGHSVGEYAAAWTAGVFDLEDGLLLAAERGRLMQALPPGAMAAVFAPEERVAAAVAPRAARLSIAAVNGPRHTVVSGAEAPLAELLAELEAEGFEHRRLRVSHAFHAPDMEPILADLERAAAGMRLAPPQGLLISSLTGRPAGPEMATPGRWARHARQPVRFADGLAELHHQGIDAFLEVGPGTTLLRMGRRHLATEELAWLPSLREGEDEWETLLGSLAGLFVRGLPLDGAGLDAGYRRRRVDLPLYPFQRQRFWIEKPRAVAARTLEGASHPLLGRRLSLPIGQILFTGEVSAGAPGYLADHSVHGAAVLPGAGYLEMALAAAEEALGAGPWELREVDLRQALVLPEDGSRDLHLVFTPRGASAASFEVHGRAPGEEGWTLHALGEIVRAEAGISGETFSPEAASAGLDPVDPAEHYAVLRAHGLDYGPRFRGIQALWRRPGASLARVALPAELEARDTAGYGLHPVLLDSCFQAVGAALESGRAGDPFLPVALASFRRLRPAAGTLWCEARMEPADHPETRRGALRLYDEQGRLVAEVRELVCKRARPAALRRSDEGWRDALYRLVWIDAPVTTLEAPLRARLTSVAAEGDLPRLRTLFHELDALSAAFAVQALRRLGWQPGTPIEADSLDIAAGQRRLFERLVAMLAEDGLLEPGALLPVDPQARCGELAGLYPACRGELDLFVRCAEALDGVLAGRVDPLPLLFPEGDAGEAGSLYRESPFARALNALAAEAVTGAVAALPAGRRLRVLEVGGGTGGTTAALIPVLPTDTEYVFTDVSPFFFESARARWGDRPGFRCARLDAETDPREQGFAEEGYDLVVAANVLHATADLRRSVRHAARLLAPGGLLLLVEGTARQRWLDLVFGLTEGWWRFADRDLRPDYPLLDQAAWLHLLREEGFAEAAAVPAGGGADEPFDEQAVIVARRSSSTAAGPWLVVEDQGGLADRLSERIPCLRVRPEGFDQAWAESTAGGRTCQGVLFLTGLDALRDGEWETELVRIGTAALGVVQTLAAAGAAVPLWLITRGAQAVEPDELLPAGPPDRPALGAAPLWGLARTIALEHPELRCTRIDLDPWGAPEDEADLLLAEIGRAPESEDQVAFRQGRRRVARLVRIGVDRSTIPEGPVRLAATRPGVLDGLELLPLERRPPGPGEVEIRVRAASLNFKDVLNVLGMYPGEAGPLGGECAGEIAALGPGATGFSVGQPVVAIAAGSLASFVTVSAAQVAPRPAEIGEAEAASAPIAFLTAEHALFDLAGLRAGERVLIHAAAGGVGLAAVQLARRAGAEVYATAGNEEKRRFLRSLGVTHVWGSRSTAWVDGVREATHGEGIDVVLNSLTGPAIPAGLGLLRPGGRFLEVGRTELWDADRAATALPAGGSYQVVALDRCDPAWVGTRLRELLADLASGRLRPLPVRSLSLARAREAFRFLEQARHVGKVVLTLPETGVRAEATYLITGGLGGLGLAVARRLVERGARHLALLSRSAPGPEAAAVLRELEGAGAAVRVIRADVSQAAEVRAALDRIGAEMPPLRGIVCSAGVLDDGLLTGQEWSRFARVLGPKALGAWHLHAATAGQPLDFFVLFSSAASLLGSAGQGNHAAANAFLDALAWERRARGLPALAINWGAWSEIGAAAARGADRRLRAEGFGSIAPAEGLAAFESLLDSGLAQAAVLPLDLPRLVVQLGGRVPPVLRDLLRGAAPAEPVTLPAPAATEAPAPVEAGSFLERLRQAPAGSRRGLLISRLQERAAGALGLRGGEDLDPDRSLFDQGLDSLLSVELRNGIKLDLGDGHALPSTLMFDYPSLGALADYLAAQVLDLSLEAPSAQEAGGAAGDAELADLSGDDLAALLAVELEAARRRMGEEEAR